MSNKINLKHWFKNALMIIFIFPYSILNAIELSSYINKKNCDQIINKKVYTICYNYKAKGAVYVAYNLDGKLVNAINIKKRYKLYTEKNLPKKYRSNKSDYSNSSYDRGHLASHGSFDYDKKIIQKINTMANIIPQSPKVNRHTWIKAEKLERLIASKLGEVSVINGIVYSSNPKRIGKNQIAVPDAFWKMIYNNDKNYRKCFYYRNDLSIVTKGDKLRSHQIDCSIL